MTKILILAIFATTAVGCTLYEHVEIEQICPPQIEQDSIIIPDWDSKN